jgi:DNA repair protein RecN (Recombination protein N)
MLREISVQNLALIADVRVELQPGFCAWTGETGAGKTLLLEALGLLLGERGSVDLIRANAEELRISGRFELNNGPLRQQMEDALGYALEDDQLIFARRLTRSGRSYAYINDQPASVATLRKLGETLVDVHSQHESQSLLQPAYQLQLLDAYGDLDELRGHYQDIAKVVHDLRGRLAELDARRQERQRELALLQFEREELEKAQLQPGELIELQKERERLVHAQALQTFALTASGQLYDDESSCADVLGKLRRESEAWEHVDSALAEVRRRLEYLTSECQDVAETLRHLAHHWEADPARLEEVENRIQHLRKLETKYGKTVDELIAYWQSLDARESVLKQKEDDQAALHTELAALFEKAITAARQLSRKRSAVAAGLAKAVERELAELGMRDARLEIAIYPVATDSDPLNGHLPGNGFEQTEILLAANRGEQAAPLRRVASGGELSRAMLALKTVLAEHDHVGTLIFDEIDANVGGRLGDVLGEKLAALGRTHQVICITHLPQVASYARHQWSIRKDRKGQRTATSIRLLDDDERLEELASMLRGKSRSETTRQEAAAMLATARPRW